jgi:hypothetical protein
MVGRAEASRGSFLRLAGGVGVLVTAEERVNDQDKPPAVPEKPEEEVSPAEGLTREHGVLERILPVYDDAIRCLEIHGRAQFTPVH